MFFEVNSVSKRYGKKMVISDICFQADKGDIVTIIGPSGVGKTTLLKIIAGLEEPTSGKVLIFEEDILKAKTKDIRKIRKKIAIIFQEFNLVDRESVLQNVLNGRLAYVSTFKSCFNNIINI